MKLTKLFEVQAGLKQHIGYKGEDKFPKMMLAMLVEFMECANDWRGFKYWSENQQPKDTLLEEYVDGLHFVLETGLYLKEMGYIHELPKLVNPYRQGNTIERQFQQVLFGALQIQRVMKGGMFGAVVKEYINLFEDFLELGRLLGFEPDQIHVAYMKKNEVNHHLYNEWRQAIIHLLP